MGETSPGQADTLFLLTFYVEENWGAWGWRVGGKGEMENRRGGQMTVTPGIWRQVAEEEESWTATLKRNNYW